MDFSGSQKIIASREQVFNALLDPAVLKASIPGAESAEYVNTYGRRELRLVISTAVPGFKGPYEIFLYTQEAVAPSHLVLVTEPSNDTMGTVKAAVTIDLADDASGTKLSYNTHADVSGKIGSVPEVVVKPIVKGAIDKFFGSFEKQVSTK